MVGGAFRLPIEVRFGDVDGMGHVNNACFATYLEHGRTRFWRDVVGAATLGEVDFILARLEIDFVAPILLEDEVLLEMRVTDVGRTSFGFDYVLTRNGEVAARGKSVQVFFDYASGKKKPVPDSFRTLAAGLAG
jgi:acyl-CoA thioester hydrolase